MTLLRSWIVSVLLSGYAFHSPAVGAGGDPNIQEVVNAWVSAAESVRTFEIRVHGMDARPTQDMQTARVPIEGKSAEVTLEFEIEYLLKRPDAERYSRRGVMPSDGGLRQYNRRRVLVADHARLLDEGAPDSHFEYDQFKLEPRIPIREPVLQPIRNLLNITGAGTGPFFDGRTFAVVAGNEQVLDGVECILAESSENNGARVWFERSKPHRIHQLQLEYLVADRTGHLEYTYRYASKTRTEQMDQDASAAEEFEFPSGWDVTVFAPDGTIRSQVECHVLSATPNVQVAGSAFELPIPPGAIIADNREKNSQYFLQLSDGTTRPIPLTDLGASRLFRLSASVIGSRIENQQNPELPEGVERIPFSRLLWCGANAIAVIVIGIFWMRRTPGPIA